MNLFEEFTRYEWTACTQCLPTGSQGYVYSFVLMRDGLQIPFYVGETGNLVRRIGEYQYKDFYAQTDFQVGESIACLTKDHGCKINLLVKESASRKVEEYRIIRALQCAGVHLLNDLLGYKYWESTRESERQVISDFCKMLVHQSCPAGLTL